MTTDHDALADRLRRLPGLAAPPAERDRTRAIRRSGSGGAQLPPGTGERLDALDAGREHPDQLARLGDCIRVVIEEVTSWDCPDLTPEGRQTWQGEVDWLLATMPRWQADTWTAGWIDTETADIERRLTRRASAVRPVDVPTHCDMCGEPLHAYLTATVQVAECQACERVLGMREADEADLPAIAQATGVHVRTLQRWASAGLLVPASRHVVSKRYPALYRLADVRNLLDVVRVG